MTEYAKGYQEAMDDAMSGRTITQMRDYATTLSGEYKRGYLAGLSKASKILK